MRLSRIYPFGRPRPVGRTASCCRGEGGSVDVADIVERFRRAAFGLEDWQDALAGFAGATDARVVHLIGMDRSGAVAFDLIRGVTPDMVDTFVREGGLSRHTNPRTGVAIDGPMLRTVFDDALLSRHERDALPIYRNLFDRADAGFAALTRLRVPGCDAILSLLRPRSFLDSADREAHIIDAAAPALSDIMAQAVALGAGLDRTVRETAELLEQRVLLLDGDRRMVQMSPGCEAWLAPAGPLTMRGGRIHARDAATDRALSLAIAQALDPLQALRPGRRVVLRMPGSDGHDEGERLILTVRAAPRRPSGPLARARVMLSAKTAAAPSAELFADLFGLTPAEAQVAVLLAVGHDSAAIARLRGCSVATVRTQVMALLNKTGTHRQGELVARLRGAC